MFSDELEHLEAELKEFEGYEWVGAGRSGINGSEWKIVCSVDVLKEILKTLLAPSSIGQDSSLSKN